MHLVIRKQVAVERQRGTANQ